MPDNYSVYDQQRMRRVYSADWRININKDVAGGKKSRTENRGKKAKVCVESVLQSERVIEL